MKHTLCASCKNPIGVIRVTLTTNKGREEVCATCGRAEVERRAREINGQYKTRKHQIRSFERQVRKEKMGLAEALRSAAMVGAVEERERTLFILSEANDLRQTSRITAMSIMEVLGYEKKGAA